MAEFAASIIGIVSAGTKVALVLSQLSADVGSAGHEARMIGGEIRSFCSVLKTLGETIENLEKSPRYAHCSELIKDMTDDSLQMFTEILNAVDKLKKMTTGRGGKDGNFGLVERVQWAVFKKPKLLVLRAAIEAYKTNLTLMLSTLSTAERVRRTSEPHNAATIAQDRQDQTLLESLELDREATLIELAQAERQYEEAESSTSILDVAPVSSPPAYDTIVMYVDPEDSGLVSSAREEIRSIRSSLSRVAVIDHEDLEAKIVRHSKRVSSMLEDDKKRLSQRWSLSLQEDSGTVPDDISLKLLDKAPSGEISNQNAPNSVRKETSFSTGPQGDHEELLVFDPRMTAQYKLFLSWVTELEAPERQEVLGTLKHDVRQLRKRNANLSVISTITPEVTPVSSPVRSISGLLSSFRSTDSMSTTNTDQQTLRSRSGSRRNRKVSALPALQYAKPIDTRASFLLDRSQRPPGRRPSPASPTSPTEDTGRLLNRSRPRPLSPALTSIGSSTASTPRQEALARLTALGQEPSSQPGSASLPALPSADETLPKIRISNHRRSRSEHTLTVARLGVPPIDHHASRRRSVHDLHQESEPSGGRESRNLASDTSGSDTDDEGSSAWWKSVGNISPQPYRRPDQILSRTKSKRQLAMQDVYICRSSHSAAWASGGSSGTQ
ncbi:hypothetical protein C7974DRAFT_106797 [Boeremia exigua]|uniref:uncharacterized protein n=1 Tax=Boeremia exigua TaxID=749465 RepID=UPI001E8DD4F0|nr:uncharacterized protein C7974DRAFT_106797 [Boeremia exigua]KAH6642652.1 hypothetical protein C7974DRAFT_106797 [Boeremia exigua]